jgi:geranylgeranyl diphosphate synthase type I
MDDILAYSSAVQVELQDYIQAKRRQAGQSRWVTDFLTRLEPFATAGKLLRGSLLCFSFEAFSGQSAGKAVIKAAAALEMTHSALLIHDDIMDDDDRRRGLTSLHFQYGSLAKDEKLPNSSIIGRNMALSAGDAAIFMALELLKQAVIDYPDSGLTELYINQLIKTCEGQMQDIYLEAQPAAPSKKAIYELMAAKTAGYTIVLPLAMGAAMAGQPMEIRRQLSTAGMAMGTIFQIRDDELGVMGSTKKTGKPVGSDIKQNKKTLLYYYLLKNCPAAERAEVQSIFGNPDITPQDIGHIQRLVNKYGVTDKLSGEVSDLKNLAFAEIKGLPLAGDARSKLEQLTEFCAKRQF